MAKKSKTVTMNLTLLAAIAAATQAGSFVYVLPADAKAFLDNKPQLVEQNPGMTDPANPAALATRATADGLTYSASNPAPQSGTSAPAGQPASTVSKPTFNLVSGVPLPEIKRSGGVGTSTYPFDSMEVGISFFVPASDDKPEPAKSLASTVSSATRRYAVQEGFKADPKDPSKQVPNMVQKRKFVIREIADGAQWGHPGVAGAAIFRTA
jgi:hypothetical protein